MNKERISLLRSFIEKEPNDPFNKYALAMEYYESEPAESLKVLRSLLTEHSDYLPTYFKAAHLMWEMEDWEAAEATFTSGIALAEKLGDRKALGELRSAFQNFQFDRE